GSRPRTRRRRGRPSSCRRSRPGRRRWRGCRPLRPGRVGRGPRPRPRGPPPPGRSATPPGEGAPPQDTRRGARPRGRRAASAPAMNPVQVMGVGYEGRDEEGRAAFTELSKKDPPDRYARLESEGARGLASEIFVILRDAYKKIGDPGKRAQAVAAIRSRA